MTWIPVIVLLFVLLFGILYCDSKTPNDWTYRNKWNTRQMCFELAFLIVALVSVMVIEFS